MNIASVKSIVDLVNLYGKKDKGPNGKLEAWEVAQNIVKQYDQDGDQALSPWEVMEAVNRSRKIQVFNSVQIDEVRKLNRQGSAFPIINLKSDTIIQGIKYKAGSNVGFNKVGQVSWGTLAEDTVFKVGYQKIKFAAGKDVNFFKNGKLNSGFLLADTIIQGIKFEGGRKVFFYKSGAVGIGTSTRKVRFQVGNQKIWIKAGLIKLHENGRFEEGKLVVDTDIQVGNRRIRFKAGEVAFHENGTIRIGTLVAATKIQGIKFAPITGGMAFYRNGKVHRGVLKGNAVVQVGNRKLMFLDATRIFFYSDGRVGQGTLGKGATFPVKLSLMSGTDVQFNRVGKIRVKAFIKKDHKLWYGE